MSEVPGAQSQSSCLVLGRREIPSLPTARPRPGLWLTGSDRVTWLTPGQSDFLS